VYLKLSEEMDVGCGFSVVVSPSSSSSSPSPSSFVASVLGLKSSEEMDDWGRVANVEDSVEITLFSRMGMREKSEKRTLRFKCVTE